MTTAASDLISKRGAATTQIDTAIKLYFENRDLISAYTLASAGDEILEGIWKNKSNEIHQRRIASGKAIRFSWHDEWEMSIKDEYQNDRLKWLNGTQNFFKHADKDPDQVRTVRQVDETGFRLLRAVTNYELVFDDKSPAMNVFIWWFLVMHQDLVATGSPLAKMLETNPVDPKKFNHSELVLIGWKNLQANCPSLFGQED